jgi:hypothetical protein
MGSPIADQDAALAQDFIGLREETADSLHDEGTVWVQCRTEHPDAPRVQLDDKAVRYGTSRVRARFRPPS